MDLEIIHIRMSIIQYSPAARKVHQAPSGQPRHEKEAILDPETRDTQLSAAVAALIGIGPKDELDA
jgi:hypothetical protein